MRTLAYADFIRALEPEVAALVEGVVDSAEKLDVEVHLVGGPVRDLLLDLPIRDVDIVVEIRGEVDAGAVARGVVADGLRIVEHERFSTTVIESGDATVDLATTRRETYAHAGALPKVEPGTLDDDLQRRDFTVNALAWPLRVARREERAAVIAPDGGLADTLADLQNRRLRVLHRASFHDDPTRALRAARLAPRLGFTLARGSRTTLRNALRDGAFGSVSGDRLRREIEKLFADACLGVNPGDALRRLEDWHVLAALEPGLAVPREAVAPLRRLGKILASPQWRGPKFRSWAAGLAVWLAPLSPAMRRRALRRFSVRGDLAKRLGEFPARRDAALAKLAKARGRGAVDSVLSELDEERLLALYAWADPPIRRRVVRWAAEDRARRSPVNGNDLLELGLADAELGRALGRIRTAFLDGAVANREEAIALARELARSRRRGARPAAATPRRKTVGKPAEK